MRLFPCKLEISYADKQTTGHGREHDEWTTVEKYTKGEEEEEKERFISGWRDF